MAMPAFPRKIPVVVGGDTIYIRLLGDEHNKRAETEDGYSLVQKDGKWYYAEKDADGLLKASAFMLGKDISSDKQSFLDGTPKHLAPVRSQSTARSRARSRTARSQSVVGQRKVLVILMEFADLPFDKSRYDFERLFNAENYSEDGAVGSVADYYRAVSYGQLRLECDILGPYKSKNKRSYYGGNDKDGDDKAPEELFKEALDMAATDVTLSDYDADGDGYVDNVHIIFAGHGEEAGADDEAIWSHEASFYQPVVLQGMKIDRYSCAPELRGHSGTGISRIGPHCHEIGHALGAMDYYDTNYSTDGEYEGTGQWDVMASGSWNNDGICPADFNPYVKAVDFGWIEPSDLPSGEVTIAPSCQGKENYYLLRSDEAGDYYLLECRSKERWGAALPGAGLLIFHVHSGISRADNEINATAPQMCYVVCASSNVRIPKDKPSSYGDINSDGCPFPGSSRNTDFGQSSTPRAFFWDEDNCGIELNHIRLDGNGAVLLSNNSTGLGNNDHQRITLFFENFESGDPQINIADNGSLFAKWQVVQNSEVPGKFADKPAAYGGTRSLQLSAKRVSDSISCRFDFGFSAPAQEGTLRLKIVVNSMNPKADSPNLLRVGYHEKEGDKWKYVEITSEDNDVWHQNIVELPTNILPAIQIEGIAYSGSVLAVDNLTIEQIIDDDETGLPVSVHQSTAPFSVFSISGNKLPSLQRGVNIIRQEDGRVKKVFVR